MSVHQPASVEVAGLTVRYGDLVAVDDVSFRAAAGEVTAVLGPNGAGKTSTIEVCEGYRQAAGGTVRVLGLDPATHQRQLSERMGVMLQEGGVYPSATVARTIKHYCDLYRRGADPDALIEAVGLTDRAGGTWRRLSGGERQRLSLALALAAVPDVAFLDEPTAGVDINGRDAIRSIIAGLRERGCVVVLATHELDEAERLADHVVIVDHGKLVASGSLATLGDGHQRITFASSAVLDVDALG
ncbi:MAG TPA: ABC transporter ATP-binding protein, partial [Ilumatobacteraceae bacterium]|nr:ABC transporter ATP-binding protein [Ilumatobacteraceae bacterium]